MLCTKLANLSLIETNQNKNGVQFMGQLHAHACWCQVQTCPEPKATNGQRCRFKSNQVEPDRQGVRSIGSMTAKEHVAQQNTQRANGARGTRLEIQRPCQECHMRACAESEKPSHCDRVGFSSRPPVDPFLMSRDVLSRALQT